MYIYPLYFCEVLKSILRIVTRASEDVRDYLLIANSLQFGNIHILVLTVDLTTVDLAGF